MGNIAKITPNHPFHAFRPLFSRNWGSFEYNYCVFYFVLVNVTILPLTEDKIRFPGAANFNQSLTYWYIQIPFSTFFCNVTFSCNRAFLAPAPIILELVSVSMTFCWFIAHPDLNLPGFVASFPSFSPYEIFPEDKKTEGADIFLRRASAANYCIFFVPIFSQSALFTFSS